MKNKFLFSSRTNWELSSNELTEKVEQLKKEQVDFIDLTESNPTRCGFFYPQKSILSSLAQEDNLKYLPQSQGMQNARQAISRYYQSNGYSVSPERIFLTSSTSEGYSFLFRLLTNPGDRVLFPQPSYPLFQFLVDLNDIVLDYYPLIYENKWVIDFAAMQAAVTLNIKAVVLVNPNNPTGSFVRKNDLSKLNDICRTNNLAIISDEVFSDFSFDAKEDFVSLVDNREVLNFTLSGISKILALPQMKLSWIVLNGPDSLVKEACARLEVIADTYLSVNTPTQNALSDWLAHKDQIQDQIKERVRVNREFLAKEIKLSSQSHLLNAEGGWYAILRIPNHLSEEKWIMEFLEKDHVWVHPGYFFDFADEAYVVISLLPKPLVFEEGIRRVIKRINGLT